MALRLRSYPDSDWKWALSSSPDLISQTTLLGGEIKAGSELCYAVVRAFLYFGSSPFSETLPDLCDPHCFPHKQPPFSSHSLPRREKKTLIYAAKLHNWALAEPPFFLYWTIYFSWYLNNLHGWLCKEWGKSELLGPFSKSLRLFSCLPHCRVYFIFSLLYLFWSLDAFLVMY